MTLYQANWSHGKESEQLLRELALGYTLNVCCGKSYVGNVRVDLADGVNHNLKADLHNLPFMPFIFDTVICDPPFSFFCKFKWIYKLRDMTKYRLILSTPLVNVKLKDMRKRIFILDDAFRFMRIWQVFDRNSHLIG